MNWKLVFLLSLFGLAMAAATVCCIPSVVEPFCWLVIFIICAIVIAKKAPGKYFLHGFFISIFNSVWVTAAHRLFFDTYSANHPEYLKMFESGQIDIDPRIFMLVTGPIFGVLFGIILGLFCWIAGKIYKKR